MAVEAPRKGVLPVSGLLCCLDGLARPHMLAAVVISGARGAQMYQRMLLAGKAASRPLLPSLVGALVAAWEAARLPAAAEALGTAVEVFGRDAAQQPLLSGALERFCAAAAPADQARPVKQTIWKRWQSGEGCLRRQPPRSAGHHQGGMCSNAAFSSGSCSSQGPGALVCCCHTLQSKSSFAPTHCADFRMQQSR